MADETEGRRQHPRYRVEGVKGSFAMSADVRIVDISLTGIGLETNSYLAVGRHYSLRVQRTGEALKLWGRVVWCKMLRTEKNGSGDVLPVYRAGIEFENILSGVAEEWLTFIGEKAIVRPERRMMGRLSIAAPAPAHIQGEVLFEVRSISAGGMLIETELQQEVADGLLDQRFRMQIELEGSTFEAFAQIIYADRLEGDEPEPDPGPGAGGGRLGVRFIELSDAHLSVLTRFISDHVGAAETVI